MQQTTHWTEKSTADFLFRIGSDFIAQIETKMETLPMKQNELAEKLGVSKGRVSQIFNNPGNLTLSMIIKCARAVGMKPSVVAYDDGDKENKYGPVHSELFRLCWEHSGKPRDIWSIKKPFQCTVVVMPSDAWFELRPGWTQLQYRREGGRTEANLIYPEAQPTEFAVNRFGSLVITQTGGTIIATT